MCPRVCMCVCVCVCLGVPVVPSNVCLVCVHLVTRINWYIQLNDIHMCCNCIHIIITLFIDHGDWKSFVLLIIVPCHSSPQLLLLALAALKKSLAHLLAPKPPPVLGS